MIAIWRIAVAKLALTHSPLAVLPSRHLTCALTTPGESKSQPTVPSSAAYKTLLMLPSQNLILAPKANCQPVLDTVGTGVPTTGPPPCSTLGLAGGDSAAGSSSMCVQTRSAHEVRQLLAEPTVTIVLTSKEKRRA